MSIKTYTELVQLPTFEERYRYLKLDGVIGKETFGFERYLNQLLYTSQEWRSVRNLVIIRDNGCDLGVEGCEIYGKVLVHHINPITIEDVRRREPWIFDPEFLITVSMDTHNAIHYGDESLIITTPLERTENDTCPWKRKM